MTTTTSATSGTTVFDAINTANGVGATTASTSEATQDRFLKLLVTQLQNQDPLNPMDNAQMTTQLAQISTVTGIDKLNTTLSSMIDSVASSQNVQTAGMIGKSVLVAGSNLELTSSTAKDSTGKDVTTKTAVGGVKLASAADSVTVTIKDKSGNVVSVQNLGAQKAGVFNYSWDGTTDAKTTADDGTYSISVSALQGTNKVEATAMQFGTVSALIRSGSTFLLDLGSLGNVALSDVQQII
ncbi:MAG: flagellar biosynthesis protein FlgD [Proteobacteria bacterium]|nr:flagellar biosynthesis protein FlgD [Pseudomonadota bacterium]